MNLEPARKEYQQRLFFSASVWRRDRSDISSLVGTTILLSLGGRSGYSQIWSYIICFSIIEGTRFHGHLRYTLPLALHYSWHKRNTKQFKGKMLQNGKLIYGVPRSCEDSTQSKSRWACLNTIPKMFRPHKGQDSWASVMSFKDI